VDGDRTPVLLVDLGGVLFSFDHERRLNVLGECLGMSPGRVDELLWQSGFSAGCDAGRYRDGPFERLFLCWLLIPNKPDPAVYRQATEPLAVPPGQVAFADDSAGNVEAALACVERGSLSLAR
jgi:hypothetical protein